MTKEIDNTTPAYYSFLLRLWQESEQSLWRASLERVATGERYGFPELASLFAFLQDECHKTATPRPPSQPYRGQADEGEANDTLPYG